MSRSPAGYGAYNPLLARLDGNLTLSAAIARARAAGFTTVDTPTGPLPLTDWKPLPDGLRVFWFDLKRRAVHDTSARPGLHSSVFQLSP